VPTPSPSRRRWRARAARFVLVVGLLAPFLLHSAGAHEIRGFWRYDPSMSRHSWKAHRGLRRIHRAWHHDHPKAGYESHRLFHHRRLVHKHRKMHHHKVIVFQDGRASWYDLEGRRGACGEPLTGMYAAHRSFACGSLLSVRRGDRYVFVRVKDRGPSDNRRRIDLSKDAFARLANPSTGVIKVRIYRLEE
jgi:Lytic transglycolase